MARRYLAIAAIFGVLSLSIGSLLASPLILHDSKRHQSTAKHGLYHVAKHLGQPEAAVTGAAAAAGSDLAAPQDGTTGTQWQIWVRQRIDDAKKWWNDKGVNGAVSASSTGASNQTIDPLSGAQSSKPDSPASPVFVTLLTGGKASTKGGNGSGASTSGTTTGSGPTSGATLGGSYGGGGTSGSGGSKGGHSTGGGTTGGGTTGGGTTGGGTTGGGTTGGGTTGGSTTGGGTTGGKLILKAIDATPQPVLSDAEMASLYDYVVVQNWVADQVPVIKTQNLSTRVLFYRAAHVTWDWQENWGAINQHESWFMHDTSGRRTRSADPNDAYYLMDIRNSEFRAYQIQYIMNFVNTYGFDGMFWDGPPGAITGWLSLSPGPDPSAAATWHQNVLTFLSELKHALGAKLLVTNSTTTYDTGVPGTDDSDYLQYVDGTEIEGFAHAPWDPATATPDSTWDWQQRMAQRNIAAGKILQVMSGVQLDGASSAAVHQWQVFTLSAYLLWADGVHAYYEWAPWGTSQQGVIFPEMTLSLGAPLGPAYSNGGVSQRDFTGGKILVNPSGSLVTLPLPQGLSSIDGSVNTQTNPNVTLSPWSALILLK